MSGCLIINPCCISGRLWLLCFGWTAEGLHWPHSGSQGEWLSIEICHCKFNNKSIFSDLNTECWKHILDLTQIYNPSSNLPLKFFIDTGSLYTTFWVCSFEMIRISDLRSLGSWFIVRRSLRSWCIKETSESALEHLKGMHPITCCWGLHHYHRKAVRRS